MNDYRYDAVKAKVRKGGWDQLSHAEKMDWHGDVYGWRRARLGVSADVQTSPADPEGIWFDGLRANYAENHYRTQAQTQQERLHAANRAKEPRLQRVADMRPEAVQADAQAIKDDWARTRGYRDCADYQEQEKLDDVDACCNIACNRLLAAALDKGKRAFNEPPERDRNALLAEMGVTAKAEKIWTAEELRAGRIALGLEREPEPEPEEEPETLDEEVA